MAHPYLVDGEVLVKSHPTLARLEILGILAFTILVPTDDRPALAELLPSLTSLKLASSTHLDARYLEHLPPTLTELFLTPSQSLPINLSMISKLPRPLETLILENIPFERDSAALGTGETISFPPGLTTLLIQSDPIDRILDALPRTLCKLKFQTTYSGAHIVVKVSKLPKRLTSLDLDSNGNSTSSYLCIALDIPLSSLLKVLKLPESGVEFITDANDLNSKVPSLKGVLPPSLTEFSGAVAHLALDNWYTTTPLLKHCSLPLDVFRGEEFPSNMPPLLTVELPSYLMDSVIDTLMPCTLTKLTASVQNTPKWLNAMAKLTQLKDLELSFNAEQLPSHGFWDLMKTRLTRLSASIEDFEFIEDVQDGWKVLEILSFTVLGDLSITSESAFQLEHYAGSTIAGASPFKTFQYPSSITNLTLYAGTLANVFANSFSNLTHLIELEVTVSGDQWDPKIAQRAVSSLPPSLASLYIFMPCYPTAALLSCLPRRLNTLRILYTGEDKRDFEEEEAKALPKDLAFFYLVGLHLGRSIDSRFGEHLQKLLYCEVAYLRQPLNSKAAEEVARQEVLAIWS